MVLAQGDDIRASIIYLHNELVHHVGRTFSLTFFRLEKARNQRASQLRFVFERSSSSYLYVYTHLKLCGECWLNAWLSPDEKKVLNRGRLKRFTQFSGFKQVEWIRVGVGNIWPHTKKLTWKNKVVGKKNLSLFHRCFSYRVWCDIRPRWRVPLCIVNIWLWIICGRYM